MLGEDNSTRIMLTEFELGNISGISSLISQHTNLDWDSFSQDPTVFNALAYLNDGSPIFPFLLKYLESIEESGDILDKERVNQKIEDLWGYYCQSIVPEIYSTLAEKFSNHNVMFKKIISTGNLSVQDRRELAATDNPLTHVTSLKDIIQSLPEAFNEEISYFFQ